MEGHRIGENGNEHYSKKEAVRRFEAALRGGLSTPPKPLKSMTKKKNKKKSPPKRG